MLYEIQKKLMNEKGKPFKHDDDHYYYIIHPDHIKNYIEFQNDTNCNNSSCNSSSKNYTKMFTINITEERNETIVIPSPHPCNNETKNQSDQNNIIERKSITFHDFDNSLPFPNDFVVTHEFQNISNKSNLGIIHKSSLLKEKKSGIIYFVLRRK